ncbi:uncharacterized protein LOC108112158 [Drosophila eugracilis]|uniref:uncharacterized protein LOC108112158 n=1 Tax=Drosophila eugracilis TaxID=29029 RepID=UPI001BD9E6EC|nr:uncharacterized protein LOC108112158 [Drosophila eugracilis]
MRTYIWSRRKIWTFLISWIPRNPLDEVNPLDESEESPEREEKPYHVAANSSSYIDQEVLENHRRIYRQLGIHIPVMQPNHPMLTFRFVLKLFLAADSCTMDFLQWSSTGNELILEYVGLQQYLSSADSIFHCRSTLQFTELLLAHGFQRVWPRKKKTAIPDTLEPVLLTYRNPKFREGDVINLHSLNLECELIRENPSKKQPRFPSLHVPNSKHFARMTRRGDLCSTSYSCRSPLQIARCQFQTILGYQADLGVLKERHAVFNRHSLTHSNMKRGRNATSNPIADVNPTKVSLAKFVKPHESVINIGIGQAPDYAGYYGKVELSKVNDFFSEYLPRYGSKITGYKDIVMDATNKSIGFQQNLPIGINYSDDEDDGLVPISSGLDMDFLPSTSAEAKQKSSSHKLPVDDSDLEQAMQELCGGLNPIEDDEDPQPSTSTSSNRTKAKPKPKPKAKPVKRQAKRQSSSSSENEDSKKIEKKKPKQRQPKKMKREPEESCSYKVETDEDLEEQEIEDANDNKERMIRDRRYDDESNDDEEEDELDEDDEDYIDKNVQYRSAPEPPKTRRYDLRNPKRHPI